MPLEQHLSREQLRALRKDWLESSGSVHRGDVLRLADAALAYLQRAEDAEKQRDDSEESARMMQDRLQRLIDGTHAAQARCARLREALQDIKDRKNQVCEGFELCQHPVCTSSYEAFAIADAALAADGEGVVVVGQAEAGSGVPRASAADPFAAPSSDLVSAVVAAAVAETAGERSGVIGDELVALRDARRRAVGGQ
jgi:hypothetical protein